MLYDLVKKIYLPIRDGDFGYELVADEWGGSVYQSVDSGKSGRYESVFYTNLYPVDKNRRFATFQGRRFEGVIDPSDK